MNAIQKTPRESMSPGQRFGLTVAVVWIFGGALWFYIRFTIVFYRANQSAIDSALKRLGNLVGFSS